MVHATVWLFNNYLGLAVSFTEREIVKIYVNQLENVEKEKRKKEKKERQTCLLFFFFLF